MERKRVLSGNRPTGKLHLGNLVGALQNWVQMQKDYECFFEVADWHALTTGYRETGELQDHIKEMVLDWFSVGIDPEKSVVFIQSHILEHAELHLLLSMISTVSRLERNPTYKEQIQELHLGDQVSYGLLGYPVLQAADILIYRAHVVPVGEDQLPHLEFTRETARRFNHLYGEIFPVPEHLLSPSPRVPGTDGRKMSKSYNNAIFLSDDEATIHEKVWNTITDPGRVRLKDPGNPQVCTIFSYYKILAPTVQEEVEQACREASRGCTQCKKQLVSEIIAYLEPIQKRRRELEVEPQAIWSLLQEGTEKAREEAQATLQLVRAHMGVGRL